MTKYLLLIIAIFFSFTSIAFTGELEIKIKSIQNKKGLILVGLYRQEGFPHEEGKINGTMASPKNGFALASFPNLQPGIYAIALFHDVNGNHFLETYGTGILKVST